MTLPVQNFQRAIGVVADGVFGPKTLAAATKYYQLPIPAAAHFFGQIAHETGGFKSFSENLKYSARGLQLVFGKYFTEAESYRFARNDIAIANRVYANRMGNGNEQSGDGWKFRGRGALHLTGRYNYKLFSDAMKDSRIYTDPDIVESNYSFDSAFFFFDHNKIWQLCRTVTEQSIATVSRRINGGTNGLQGRINYTIKFYNSLR